MLMKTCQFVDLWELGFLSLLRSKFGSENIVIAKNFYWFSHTLKNLFGRFCRSLIFALQFFRAENSCSNYIRMHDARVIIWGVQKFPKSIFEDSYNRIHLLRIKPKFFSQVLCTTNGTYQCSVFEVYLEDKLQTPNYVYCYDIDSRFD